MIKKRATRNEPRFIRILESTAIDASASACSWTPGLMWFSYAISDHAFGDFLVVKNGRRAVGFLLRTGRIEL
jgi:hypothetical protein